MDEQTRHAARLWTLAQPAVSAFIGASVRDRACRDDVLQDVAVAVLESFGTYDPSRPFVGWALGIARHQVLRHIRSRGRVQVSLPPETMDRLAETIESVAAEDHPKFDHLDECLQTLETHARRICELRYQQDLKPAAIAQLLNQSANTVAKTLQRIRDLLRECIERKFAANLTLSVVADGSADRAPAARSRALPFRQPARMDQGPASETEQAPIDAEQLPGGRSGGGLENDQARGGS